jgi:hypothetical protein
MAEMSADVSPGAAIRSMGMGSVPFTKIPPLKCEDWLNVRAYIDESGNGLLDPKQKTFLFGALVFRSEKHRDCVVDEARRLRILGVGARNPRPRTPGEERLLEDLLGLLEKNEVVVSVSHVDVDAASVHRLGTEGVTHVLANGVAILVPEFREVSGRNWIWISLAIKALANTLARCITRGGLRLSSAEVIFDERTLDPTTRAVFASALRQLTGPQALRALFEIDAHPATVVLMNERVRMGGLAAYFGSDSTIPALRLAHWLARFAMRGLNPADTERRPDWIARMQSSFGPSAIWDTTPFM